MTFGFSLLLSQAFSLLAPPVFSFFPHPSFTPPSPLLWVSICLRVCSMRVVFRAQP